MALTKLEQRKLKSLSKRAKKLEKAGRDLAKDVKKELVRQMKRS